MSMSPNSQHWHRMYEDAPWEQREAIDRAMVAVRRELVSICEPNNCDPAEELVGAIMKYVFKSKAAYQKS
jgi:hypothetical protein